MTGKGGMDEKRFTEIFTAAGFDVAVVAYLWATRANDFPLEESRLKEMAAATTDYQKQQLAMIAARWRQRQKHATN